MIPVNKENSIGNKNPMFLRFVNGESGVRDLLTSFSQSKHPLTAKTAEEAMKNPPDLEYFREELEGAVRDIISNGIDDDFKAFVNHYMQPSLAEEVTSIETSMGENKSQFAVIKDPEAPWIQGFVCYNLYLYIKAFGMQEMKLCKTCGKIFTHKGKYAAYCSDPCKAQKNEKPSPN